MSGGLASRIDLHRGFRGRRRLCALAAATAVPSAVVAVLVTNGGDIAAAATRISPEAFALVCAFTLAGFLARTEAWGVCLSAAGSTASRPAVHAASSSLYILTNVSTQLGHVARIALLRRVAPDRTPPLGAMVVAEAPAAVAAGGAAVVMALAAGSVLGLPAWTPFAGVALLVLVVVLARTLYRHLLEHPSARGLAALADCGYGGRLAGMTALASVTQIARAMVVLAAFGGEPTIAAACVVLLVGGLVNNLPLGGTVGTAAATTALAGGGFTAGAGAGVVITAGTAVAAVLYALVAAAALAVERRRVPAVAAPLAPAPAVAPALAEVVALPLPAAPALADRRRAA